MSHRSPLITFAACLAVGLITITSTSTAAPTPGGYLKKPDVWFSEPEAKRVAANILSFQSDLGGWPKNETTTEEPFQGDRESLKPTYDNHATTDELRFLARIHTATKDPAYLAPFERGLDYVLEGQYANGGWPQFHPPGTDFHRHITFNDDAMVRLLQFVREVATDERYAFVDEARRKRAAAAFDRGIGCIQKCQIKVGDTLTGWCAQHDEIDYQARSARTYELATLSGGESVGITRLLMSLDTPTPEIVNAVEAAVAWLESVKLTGIRLNTVKDEKGPKGENLVVVTDPAAPPFWARFYDIETNQPIFVDRDGVPKPNLADIGYERRNGYAWYGTWAQKILEAEYPAWRERVADKVGR